MVDEILLNKSCYEGGPNNPTSIKYREKVSIQSKLNLSRKKKLSLKSFLILFWITGRHFKIFYNLNFIQVCVKKYYYVSLI